MQYWSDPSVMLNELRKQQLNSLRRAEARAEVAPFPPVNIYDDGDAFMVRAELPGVDKTKLDITAKGNRLAIQGERVNGGAGKDSYHRREREMGTFKRVVALPEQVDPDQTTASYDNGVLQIVCPRAAGAKTHRIKVD